MSGCFIISYQMLLAEAQYKKIMTNMHTFDSSTFQQEMLITISPNRGFGGWFRVPLTPWSSGPVPSHFASSLTVWHNCILYSVHYIVNGEWLWIQPLIYTSINSKALQKVMYELRTPHFLLHCEKFWGFYIVHIEFAHSNITAESKYSALGNT